MTKIIKAIILTVIILNLFIITANFAEAQLLQGPTTEELQRQDQAFLEGAGLGSDPGRNTLGEVVADIIRIFLSFLGVVFVVLIIYAGWLWMSSAGNEEKIDKAKRIMTSAFIGLLIVLAAYAITYFVIDKILEATGTSTQGLD
ncbi:hypothetical protein HYZ76_01335 [Candidatus Falkowbacteria bacterium]|nr:hypothetical protein [Candidatus Falkowbacteria bacterium]